MKKLLNTMIAVAFAVAGGAALANIYDPDDDATDFMPNAQLTVESIPATGPIVYDADEGDTMKVVPNAQLEVAQVAYVWGTYPTDD